MRVKKWLVVFAALLMAFAFIACDKSSDDNNSKGMVSGKKINMSGGNATTGTGGGGGTLDIAWVSSGGIIIDKEGKKPDTSFNVPNYPKNVDLGTNGWEVEASQSVMAYPAGDDSGVAANEYHTHNQQRTLYQRNAAGTADVEVTGILIHKRVTLTLMPNYDAFDADCEEWSSVWFTDDVEIIGTLTTMGLNAGLTCAGSPEQRHGGNATAADAASLEILAHTIFVRPSALVSAAGADATATNTRGGDGGQIYFEGYTGIINEGDFDGSGGDGLGTGVGGDGGRTASDNVNGVYLYGTDDGGPVINKGVLNASGGDGSVGGGAGAAYIYAETFVFNTGDLYANGGVGSAGTGGDANYVELYSNYASCFNRGNLYANGGDGPLGGGDGNYIYFYSSPNDDSVGDLINSGDLEANGGDALSNGDGGDAGYLYLYTYGGTLQSSGRVEGIGGAGAGAGNDGGDGANLYLYSGNGYGYTYGYYVQHGDMIISNNITLNGGDGLGGGGNGGDIDISDNVGEYPSEAPGMVKLVGFNKVETNGGEGATGGDGGTVEGWTYSPEFNDGYVAGMAGPIVISNVIIEANGGQGLTGSGGDGGEFDFYEDLGDWDYANADENTYTRISGDILINGGDGVTSGGDGGDIYIGGYFFTKNSAGLSVNGGAASNGTGGDSGDVDLSAELDAYNNGGVSLNGGAGTTSGGDGGEFDFEGATARNSGNVKARGGNATTAGGDGGDVSLIGTRHPVKNSGSIDVRGGSGTTPGLLGVIYFDLLDVTPADGTLG